MLDVGIGPGGACKALYKEGYQITGLDFSAEMLEQARKNLPRAELLQGDFAMGLPDSLLSRRFDAIIIAYALHHLDPDGQAGLLETCKSLLSPGGLLLIGDVMTRTREQMQQAKHKDRHMWDEDESYLVVEELQSRFPGWRMAFDEKSYCSGVLIIT